MASKLLLGIALLCLVGYTCALVHETDHNPSGDGSAAAAKRFFFRPYHTERFTLCPFWIWFFNRDSCTNPNATSTTSTTQAASAGASTGNAAAPAVTPAASADAEEKPDAAKAEEAKPEEGADKDEEKKDETK